MISIFLSMYAQCLPQWSQNFSKVGGQIVNILDFVDHPVSFATTQLCHSAKEVQTICKQVSVAVF